MEYHRCCSSSLSGLQETVQPVTSCVSRQYGCIREVCRILPSSGSAQPHAVMLQHTGNSASLISWCSGQIMAQYTCIRCLLVMVIQVVIHLEHVAAPHHVSGACGIAVCCSRRVRRPAERRRVHSCSQICTTAALVDLLLLLRLLGSCSCI